MTATATITPFPSPVHEAESCVHCHESLRPAPRCCQVCQDQRDARLAAEAVRAAHAGAQEVRPADRGAEILRGLPEAVTARPAVRICWSDEAGGGWGLAADQSGTLLAALAEHVGDALARRDQIAAYQEREPGGWSPWRDGAPPDTIPPSRLNLAFVTRPAPYGPDRLRDPMQAARWIAVLDGLVRGPLAPYLMEGGVGLELSRLRSWLEREADPSLRGMLFEDGAFAGPVKLPAAQLSEVMDEPTDYARGYDDGWNAYRLALAHQAPGRPAPPERITLAATVPGREYRKGYDDGWNACAHAASRAGAR